MRIAFNLNQLPYSNNITMRGNAPRTTYLTTPVWFDGTSAPKLNAGPDKDTVSMRSYFGRYQWAKVDNQSVNDGSLTPEELMKMQDVPFFKDSPSPLEAQTELDDAVDYWYATFKKPGNATEFAAMCFRNRQQSAVADRLAQRAAKNLSYKIDYAQLGGESALLRPEEDVKLGALFEYFNSDSDSHTRWGVRRPSYIRSETQYLEALKADNSPDYSLEKERIERKRMREDITREDVSDAWANAKITPIEIFGNASQEPGEKIDTVGSPEEKQRRLDKIALGILITNHPRMIGNQYTDDGIGLREVEEPSPQDLEDAEEKALRAQNERNFQKAKAAWTAWQKKSIKYRLSHRSEKPPYPKLKLTPKQIEEMRSNNEYDPSQDEGPGVKWYDMN